MRVVLLICLVLGLASITSAVHFGRKEAEPVTMFALLDGSNEVPPVTTPARGLALLQYDPHSMNLIYHVQWHDIASEVTGVHLHGLDTALDKRWLSTSGRGTPIKLTARQAALLLKGDYYMNVHTVDNPDGEIRGDVIVGYPGDDRFYTAQASNNQETNPLGFAGAAVGLLNKTSADTLWVNAFWSSTDVADVHVHGPGGLGIEAAKPCTFPLPDTAAQQCVFGVPDEAGLAAADYYMNFHNAGADPMYRGQLIPLATATPVNSHFAAFRLTPAELYPVPDTNATGMVVAAYDDLAATVSLEVWHSANPSSASIVLYTEPNTVVAELCGSGVSCASPVSFTSDALTWDVMETILAGKAYVAVHTTAFPTGEIAGHVAVGNNMYGSVEAIRKYSTVMTNYQEVGSIPDSGYTGAAFFYVNSTDDLTFEIWHNVPDATGVHIHYGEPVGFNTPGANKLDVTPAVPNESPIRGTYSLSLTSSTSGMFSESLLNGLVYVNIHSTSFPSGDVRGQVGPMAAVTPPMITHTASLTPDQEVVVPDSSAYGAAILSYSPKTRAIHYRIYTHNIASTVTKIHMHNGNPGVNGDLVFALAGEGSEAEGAYTPVSNPISGVTAPLSPKLASEFLNGKFYFNVHTTQFPDGELRGVILYDSSTLAAALNPWQEVIGAAPTPCESPGAVTTAPVADGVAVFQTNNTDGSYTGDYQIFHPLMPFLTQTHFHYGAAAGSNAGTKQILEICSPPASYCTSPVSGSAAALDAPAVVNARVGLSYINLHTSQQPTGAIRGQMRSLRPSITPAVKAVTYTVATVMDGDNVVPSVNTDNRGLFIGLWDDKKNELTYSLWHSIDSPRSVFIGNGGVGGNGKEEFELAGNAAASASPVTGTISLSNSQTSDLKDGLFHVVVTSDDETDGEIRGNIVADPKMYVGIGDGAQELPTTSSSARGAAAVTLKNNNADYTIVHSLGYDAYKIHVHNGEFGVGGPLVIDAGTVAGSAASPLQDTAALSADDAKELSKGNFYLNLHSYTYPAGEVRGQLSGLDGNKQGFAAAAPKADKDGDDNAATGLSLGATIGIAVGAVGAVALIGGGAFAFYSFSGAGGAAAASSGSGAADKTGKSDRRDSLSDEGLEKPVEQPAPPSPPEETGDAAV